MTKYRQTTIYDFMFIKNISLEMKFKKLTELKKYFFQKKDIYYLIKFNLVKRLTQLLTHFLTKLPFLYSKFIAKLHFKHIYSIEFQNNLILKICRLIDKKYN